MIDSCEIQQVKGKIRVAKTRAGVCDRHKHRMFRNSFISLVLIKKWWLVLLSPLMGWDDLP